MNELSVLAEKYHTDKGVWGHGYTEIYDDYLKHLRNEKFVFIEIGIGGYDNPNTGGESLYMWADYFPNAEIHGVDYCEKKLSGRFHTHKGDQADEGFLHDLISKIGQPMVVLDDASHINSKTIKSFDILFPFVTENGIYIVEDVQTNYLKEFGGRFDISTYNNDTIIGHLLYRVHEVNIQIDGLVSTAKSFHFHRNCVIIKK